VCVLRRLLFLELFQSELRLNSLELELEDFLIVVTVIVVGHHNVLEGPAGRKRLFARRRRDVTVAFLAHAVSVFLPTFLTFGRAEESVEGGLWWPIHVVLRRDCGVVSTDAVHYDRTTTGFVRSLNTFGFWRLADLHC